MRRRQAAFIVGRSGSKHRPRTVLGSVVGASLLVGGSLLTAPAASAAASPCADQAFFTSATSACTIADGETVVFLVVSAAGGMGGNSFTGQLGGFGGYNYIVSGTYTNESGSTEMIDVTVGVDGAAGVDGDSIIQDGANGASGTESGLAVNGGSTIVTAAGGGGGTGGLQSGAGRADSGANGYLEYPVFLPSGWSGAAGVSSPAVFFFAAPTPVPDSGSTMPAPPVMQQFGAPLEGTCDDAAPADLNWEGFPSGGWSRSWAQWMNGELGGEVCVRTLVQRAGAWTFGD